MRIWLKSGFKALVIGVIIALVLALGMSWIQAAFGAPFVQYFMESFALYLAIIALPVFLMALLVSYMRHRKL